jgi:hypothetical protein
MFNTLRYKFIFLDSNLEKNFNDYMNIISNIYGEEKPTLVKTFNTKKTNILVVKDINDNTNINITFAKNKKIDIMTEKEFQEKLLLDSLGKNDIDLNLNIDEKRRLEILNDNLKSGENYSGGTMRFWNLDLKKLETLFSEEFIHPKENQNESPTNHEFLMFGRKYPFTKFHGYIVSPDRTDYRVSLEGVGFSVEINKLKDLEQFKKDFYSTFKDADEIEIESMFSNTVLDVYCWFD